MSDIATLVSSEISQETDDYILHLHTFSDGSTSREMESKLKPAMADQRHTIEQLVAAAQAGVVSVSPPFLAGLEVALWSVAQTAE